jgi:hypothetical protein
MNNYPNLRRWHMCPLCDDPKWRGMLTCLPCLVRRVFDTTDETVRHLDDAETTLANNGKPT